jgi:hypothetical protein
MQIGNGKIETTRLVQTRAEQLATVLRQTYAAGEELVHLVRLDRQARDSTKET